MQITFNTEDLSMQDRSILAFVSGGQAAVAAATPKATTTPKAAPAPAPEPPDEDLLGSGPTLEYAIEVATEMVGKGEGAKVKAALVAVDTKRVSELDVSNVAAFLSALDA